MVRQAKRKASRRRGAQDPHVVPSIEFSPENPWRDPDWRWKRAQAIVNGEIPYSRNREDMLVRKAVTFIQELGNTPVELAAALIGRRPNLYWARRLRTDRQDNVGATRAEVEARILAAEPWGDIHSKTSIPVDTLQTYAALFFDVTHRLKETAWVLHTVIGKKYYLNLKEQDFQVIWAIYGYTYGPHMLDTVIQRSLNLGIARPRGPEEIKAAWRDDGVFSMLIKQALATRMIQPSGLAQINLLEVYSKFVEIDRMAGETASASGSNTFVASIATLLNSMGASLVVGEFRDAVDSTTVSKYDLKGIELSTPRLVQAAQNLLPPEYDLLLDLKYPEPQNAGSQQGSREQTPGVAGSGNGSRGDRG